MPEATLYFAYAEFLDPERIAAVAPGAQFRFTAHYPETRLAFVSNGTAPVATLHDDAGHTVWGAVFDVPSAEVAALTAAEAAGGRVPGWSMKAVDREGNKYECLTFVSPDPPNGHHSPESENLLAMIAGARHWKLPAGWVVGLEDLAEEPLFG